MGKLSQDMGKHGRDWLQSHMEGTGSLYTKVTLQNVLIKATPIQPSEEKIK